MGLFILPLFVSKFVYQITAHEKIKEASWLFILALGCLCMRQFPCLTGFWLELPLVITPTVDVSVSALLYSTVG